MNELVIVGSGCAGTWAAYQAVQKGIKPVILDVGMRSGTEPILSKNIFELRQQDPSQREYLLGKKYETLHNLHHSYMTPKLKAPRYRYVIERSSELGPLELQGFDPVQSFALGGLANAWGAGVFRYLDKDLQRFPFKGQELEPYFDAMTGEVGISGEQDDLTEHFGPVKGLQKPLKLDAIASRLLSVYQNKKDFFRRNGLTLGKPRLALLSEPLPGRAACGYDNLTFWQPDLPYVYSPAMTMKKLIAANKVEYLDQRLVEKFQDKGSSVVVMARNLKTGARETYEAKKLILGAGAINSARLVLQSFDDHVTQLPLLENQISLIPFIHPGYIGSPVEGVSTGLTQLNVLYEGPLSDNYVQASFYGVSSPLATDLFRDLPLSAQGNRFSAKYILPAISVLQAFYQDEPHPSNYLKLQPNGVLTASYGATPRVGKIEKHFIRLFRKAGFISHSALVQYPVPGNGIHYAGTLPMSQDTKLPYRTDSNGSLACAKNVYVADAAVFPVLPAKNLSFAIMAIAMRTANKALQSLGA